MSTLLARLQVVAMIDTAARPAPPPVQPFAAFAWSDWKAIDGNKMRSPGGRVLSKAVFDRMAARDQKSGPAPQAGARPESQARPAAAPAAPAPQAPDVPPPQMRPHLPSAGSATALAAPSTSGARLAGRRPFSLWPEVTGVPVADARTMDSRQFHTALVREAKALARLTKSHPRDALAYLIGRRGTYTIAKQKLAVAANSEQPFRRSSAGEVIRGADLFASGVYRGQEYTVADLDEIARNFTRLRQLLDPPAVLGHEESQEFLDALLGSDREREADAERTDQPAAGWVDRVWVDKYVEPSSGRLEGVLKGDITGVPAKIAEMIRNGRYKKISAEIYDDFTDDYGQSYGKALRRVAILGAEVPQVKRLGDLPAPTAFAERMRALAAMERQARAAVLRAAVGRVHERSRAREAKEVSAVRRYAAAHAGSLRSTGCGATPEQFVAAFCELRRKRPGLTAVQFGVPAAFYA